LYPVTADPPEEPQDEMNMDSAKAIASPPNDLAEDFTDMKVVSKKLAEQFFRVTRLIDGRAADSVQRPV
jgi:hypothetical protein